MSAPLPPHRVRPLDWSDPTEVNYVRKTWLKSNQASGLARLAGRTVYWSEHHDLVERLLKACETRVACAEESPTTILGFAVLAPPGVVHYVFVGEDWRRRGLARELVAGLGERVAYTHRTDLCSQLPIPESWRYNLYKAAMT